MPNNEMDYSLIHRTPDGNGKILVTTPGSPDKGSWETEAELKTYVNQDVVMKTDIVQTLGQQIDKVPSNKAVDDAINAINTRVTNIEDTLMGENEITVQYPDDGNYPSLMPNKAPLRALKYAEVPRFRGNSRAWNQLAKAQTITNFCTKVSDTEISVNYSTSSTIYAQGTEHFSTISGHKYLLYITGSSGLNLRTSAEGIVPYLASVSDGYLGVVNGDGTNNSFLSLINTSSSGSGTVRMLVRDLTLILSDWSASDITTANIHLMVQQIPDLLKYNAYDAGSLVDTVVSGVRSRGVNWWNGQYEVGNINDSTGQDAPSSSLYRSVGYTEVRGGQSYYWLSTYNSSHDGGAIYLYDADKNFIKMIDDCRNMKIDITPETAYIRFKMIISYFANEQIALDSSPVKTTYHPYKSDTLSLPEPVTLRGVGTCVETYDPATGVLDDGKFVLVDLGSLNWDYVNGWGDYAINLFYVIYTLGAASDYEGICPKYIVKPSSVGAGLKDKELVINDPSISATSIAIADSGYSSASDFKTAMSGVYLLCEKATYTPSSPIDPIPYNFLEVEGGGTVETIQTQTPVIDNSLDVTYDIIPQ